MSYLLLRRCEDVWLSLFFLFTTHINDMHVHVYWHPIQRHECVLLKEIVLSCGYFCADISVSESSLPLWGESLQGNNSPLSVKHRSNITPVSFRQTLSWCSVSKWVNLACHIFSGIFKAKENKGVCVLLTWVWNWTFSGIVLFGCGLVLLMLCCLCCWGVFRY